jgi:transposase
MPLSTMYWQLFLSTMYWQLTVFSRGGRHRENLSKEEEEKLLKQFFNKAKDGGILVVSEIKLAYERQVGHKVPKSTVYRMLSRNGWRKIVPYHRHPQADLEKQKEFKKNFR